VALLYASANLGGPPTASANQTREVGGSASGGGGGGGARKPGERGANLGPSPAGGGGGSAGDTELRQLPSAGAPEGERTLHLHVAVRGIRTGYITHARIQVSACLGACTLWESGHARIAWPETTTLCALSSANPVHDPGAEGGSRRCRRCYQGL
jgi:hypothetical protein